MANRRLSSAVADLGWGEFARQLAYKADWHHADLHVVDRWYPSTKTCSTCGYLSGDLPLSARAWTCPVCLSVLERDHNAAINLAVHASRTRAAKGTVAPKQGSTRKARRGERSGPTGRLGETISGEASTEPSRLPA
jgi:putative transposase